MFQAPRKTLKSLFLWFVGKHHLQCVWWINDACSCSTLPEVLTQITQMLRPHHSGATHWKLQLGDLREERQTDLTQSTGSSLQHFGTFGRNKGNAGSTGQQVALLQAVWVWERKRCCCRSRVAWEGLANVHSERPIVSHMYINPECAWTGVLLTFQSAQRVDEGDMASVCICRSLHGWV